MILVQGPHPGPLPCTRYLAGADAEREAIVAWLRAQNFHGAADLAKAIEAQRHHRPVSPLPFTEGVV